MGGRLKSENPVRFRDREHLKSFFRNAVARGFVEEVGSGPEIILRLPARLEISFTDDLPCAVCDLPFGLSESSKSLPYLAFVPESESNYAPIGSVPVTQVGDWKVLSFDKKVKLIIACQNYPWLKNAVFVDWKSVENRQRWEKIAVSNMLPFGIPPEDMDLDESGNPPFLSSHVSGYAAGTTAKEIRDLFSKHVSVISVVPKFNNAYMFVNTCDLALAVKTRQALAGTSFNGGILKVMYCKA